MVKRHIRKDRIFIGFLILTIIIIFPADSIRRLINRHNDNFNANSTIVIRFNGSISEDILKIQNPENDSSDSNTPKFTEIAVESSQLVSGALVKVNSNTPYTASETASVVDLVDYRNDYYTLINETDSVILSKEAADALNMMMKDYYNSTGLTNFLVYGTTNTYTGNDSYCPQYFPESATANTIDLAVNIGNSVMSYDGCDDEKWIIDNCHKYGYILRFPAGKTEETGMGFYPWHLRYVGKVHAAAMNELNYCFEEYLEFLKNYTFDHPLSYNLKGSMYYIYSVQYAGETTSVPVPLSGNYTVSGNNTDSFIVTSVKF